jgi:hypothetical protein
MLQNLAIDIAIGLILMYLVLSLVCTVINEYIATKLNLRAKSLAAGLQELLDDPLVHNAFYDHGLIAGTRRALARSAQTLTSAVAPFSPAPAPVAPAPGAPAATPAVAPALAAAPAAVAPTTVDATLAAAPTFATQPGDHPSYLSADTFVLALVGSLTGTRLAKDQPVPADLQAAIQALPPSKIKSALLTSLMTAQGDFETFRKNLATWFDDAMERLSGAYKRHLKFITIVVGFAVAVIINADTFAVGYALWSNAALRAQMVQVATDTVTKGLPKTQSNPHQRWSRMHSRTRTTRCVPCCRSDGHSADG